MADDMHAPPENGARVRLNGAAASPRAGFLERTFTRLFMRPALVVGVTELSRNFRLIDFEGEPLKECDWSPGDKVQVKLDGGMITRTYTPIGWNRAKGRTLFLAYCHGAGPGSEWARRVVPGDERQFFGPRSSLSLEGLASSTILFGDETSFALALALARQPGANPFAEQRYVFEVSDRAEAASVLDLLELPDPILVERRADDGHLPEIADIVVDLMQPASDFVLSGKASSIQHVGRTLKAHGVETRRLRAKAYWAPGKTGLD
ncbi:MAG: siderophore-interacting protein [Sphingomonas sp.]|uniref:siderophore-interacting protein n=1 Tax=Sphingomonas sp. TaxID=28214 RepID=UPI0022742064|nr:siderophore-interacting protein [Sphingomonas sp.]MCX8477991.1 siderophore-interacting protein [Sphingomonas sp.]